MVAGAFPLMGKERLAASPPVLCKLPWHEECLLHSLFSWTWLFLFLTVLPSLGSVYPFRGYSTPLVCCVSFFKPRLKILRAASWEWREWRLQLSDWENADSVGCSHLTFVCPPVAHDDGQTLAIGLLFYFFNFLIFKTCWNRNKTPATRVFW